MLPNYALTIDLKNTKAELAKVWEDLSQTVPLTRFNEVVTETNQRYKKVYDELAMLRTAVQSLLPPDQVLPPSLLTALSSFPKDIAANESNRMMVDVWSEPTSATESYIIPNTDAHSFAQTTLDHTAIPSDSLITPTDASDSCAGVHKDTAGDKVVHTLGGTGEGIAEGSTNPILDLPEGVILMQVDPLPVKISQPSPLKSSLSSATRTASRHGSMWDRFIGDNKKARTADVSAASGSTPRVDETLAASATGNVRNASLITTEADKGKSGISKD